MRDEHCLHRRASLAFGRSEACGLRCLYHGGKFDVDGHAVDMSSEPTDARLRASMQTRAYPVREAGGFVWVWMGDPAAPAPFVPPVWAAASDERIAIVKMHAACNWAQVLEGAIDSAHSSSLHSSPATGGSLRPEGGKPMTILAGKTVFLTGAGNGLGRAHALRLASHGARVVVADRDDAGAADTVDAVRTAGGAAQAVHLEVSDEASVTDAFAQARAAFGEVEVLVNNAGGVFAPVTAAENITLDQWLAVLAVNLTGPWLCARAAIPAMKAAGRGRIINISSTSFSQGAPTELVPYITSKGGVVGFTRSLARELGPFGITVNAVAPGFVPKRAEQVAPSATLGMGKRDAIRAMVLSQQCIPRVGEPEDIAGAVAFLASDASAFMTGQVMNVDGGWALA